MSEDALVEKGRASGVVYVTDAETLLKLCNAIAGAEYIAVDTEFSRTRSYYPVMSLLQVAAPNIAFAVDLLKLSAQDLEPLFTILRDPRCCKVLHSGRQDIEGIYNTFSVIMTNVFDTQVAMQFSGSHGQPGYEAMVRNYLHIQIAKEMQFSNWMQRPLTREQLEYAIADVVYLLEVYPIVRAEIVNAGKLGWLQEECENMIAVSIAPASCYEITRKLGMATTDEIVIVRAYRLVQWREQNSVQLNLNRIFVMPDQMLLYLARKPDAFPKNNTQYNKIGSRNKVPGSELRHLVQSPPALVTAANEQELAMARSILADNRKTQKTPLYTTLKELLRIAAIEHNISEPFLASQLDLLRLASKQRSKLDSGWRYEVFGRLAMAARDAST